ncbi:MAG: hypothetical protein ACO25F_01445 [Erythrobacter sp.]
MEGNRNEQAIRRIEAALSRIEAAAGAVAPSSSNDLAFRDQALRGEVTAVLSELDRLIKGLEP